MKYKSGSDKFMKLLQNVSSRFDLIRDVIFSLAFSIVLFSPLLFSKKPELLFAGDLHNLYFPQFIRGYYLAKQNIWYGVDLLTNNGSSVYFLRPNIPAYYPLHFVIYKLFAINGITQFANAFVLSLCAQASLAFFATLRLSQSFLKLEFKYSLFFAVAFVFSIAKSNGLTPFYYIASLFPVLVYVALISMRQRSWLVSFIGSFAYICAFLSGYLPLAVHGVVLSVVVALGIRWIFEIKEAHTRISDFAYAVSPCVLAGIIVSPLYFSILRYHQLVAGIPEGVWGAHEFWYQIPDVLSLLSSGFLPSTKAETPHVIIGLIPLLIIVLPLFARSPVVLNERNGKLVVLALVIFGFHVLLAAGSSTGLPDIFYYLVPGLGKMHLYGRYLISTSFLVFLAATLQLKALVEMPEPIWFNRILLFIVAVLCLLYVTSTFVELENTQVNVLTTELVLLALFVVTLRSINRSWSVLFALIAVMLIKLGSFNSLYNHISPASPSGYANALIFSPERQQAFLNHMRQYAPNKAVIKYADLTTSIDKQQGVLLNFPWLIGPDKPVSNYMGYELHLSLDRDYLRRFPFFGKVDLSWMEDTGADYLILDSEAKKNYSTELERYIDRSVPLLDLGFGIELANFKNKSVSTNTVVNNGVFDMSSNDPFLSVGQLEGNLSSRLALDVRSAAPVTIKYLFFPSKLMQFVVNGEPLELDESKGLAQFELPAGEYRIEYLYKGRLHLLFLKAFAVYMCLLLLVLAWMLFKKVLRYIGFAWDGSNLSK